MLSISLKDLQQLTPKYGMHIESSLHAKSNNLTLVFASQVSGFPGRDQCVQIVRLHHAVWSSVDGCFMHTSCKWWCINSSPHGLSMSAYGEDCVLIMHHLRLSMYVR